MRTRLFVMITVIVLSLSQMASAQSAATAAAMRNTAIGSRDAAWAAINQPFSPAACISADFQLSLIESRTNPNWSPGQAATYANAVISAQNDINAAYDVALSTQGYMDAGNGYISYGDNIYGFEMYAGAYNMYSFADAKFRLITAGWYRLRNAQDTIEMMQHMLED